MRVKQSMSYCYFCVWSEESRASKWKGKVNMKWEGARIDCNPRDELEPVKVSNDLSVSRTFYAPNFEDAGELGKSCTL